MNLKRALVAGAGAIGIAYLVKLMFQKDIERYNRIAEMSGDKPLMEDQLDKLKSLVGVGGRNGSR